MGKTKYLNSAMGLYGVGNPTNNLYAGKVLDVEKTNKVAQANAEDFLYADGESEDEILQEDNFDFFPLKNPDTNEIISPIIGEGLYSLTNGSISFYANKNTYVNDERKYDYSIGQTIGYVKEKGTAKRGNATIRVSNDWGKDIHKKVIRDFDWINNDTNVVGVMRKVDENGNMTNEPFTTINQKTRFERVANILTLGGYGLTKFTIQSSIGASKWLLTKEERNKVKEFNKCRRQLNKNIDKLVSLQDEIKNKQIDLANKASNPKDNVVTTNVWNGSLKDYVSMVMSSKSKYTIQGENRDSFINHYTDGVKLKNYLDSKCKKASGNGANGKAVEYTNILARLYFGSIWNLNYYVFNNKSWNQQTPVIVTAKSILSATKDKESHSGDFQFGFTQSVYDKMPTFHIESVAIAYWLQQLGEKGYEEMTNENSEAFLKNMVKVCSYAFWGLYLNPLKTWADATDRTQQNTAFIRYVMVEPLVSKGYSINNLSSIVKGSAETADRFYREIMCEKRWINTLSTFEQYPFFDTDFILMKIEEKYNECVKINNENLPLIKTINDLVKKSYIAKYANEANGIINDGKALVKNIKDAFDSSSAKNRAIESARQLKRELMPRCEEHAKLEVEVDKIEANMTKTKQDIETYQRILDDTSNDETTRKNADSMLDKLSDDMEKFIEKQEKAIENEENYSEKEITPREERFLALGEICDKVGNIFARYKRQSARREYRLKKKEMKDELKNLYGKGWRKKGNWKDIKIEYKVERNKILQEYQSVFGKVAHGALAFVLMPARNIVTVLLMLNIGGATTRLEQMKNVHDGNGKTSDEIKIRNLYELILQRWYSIGGKKEFLDKIIAKYGKAKPIANQSTNPDDILKENNMSAEKIAEMDSEIKLDATGKQYLNFVVSEYITTILGYVKSFFGWLLQFLSKYGKLLCSLLGALFGGGDNDGIVGNGGDYDPAEDCAGQLALLNAYLATNPDPMPTDEQIQKMTDLICDSGYTFQQAYKEVMGIDLTIKTDAKGNTIIEEEGNTALGVGIGVGIGVLALCGIIWAVLSD